MKLSFVYLFVGSLALLIPPLVLSAETKTTSRQVTTKKPVVTTPKVEETTPKVEETTPKEPEETTPKVEETTPKEPEETTTKQDEEKLLKDEPLLDGKKLNFENVVQDLNQAALPVVNKTVCTAQELASKFASRIDNVRTNAESGFGNITSRLSEEASKIPILSSMLNKSDSGLPLPRLPFIRPLASNKISEQGIQEIVSNYIDAKDHEKNVNDAITAIFNVKQGLTTQGDDSVLRAKREGEAEEEITEPAESATEEPVKDDDTVTTKEDAVTETNSDAGQVTDNPTETTSTTTTSTAATTTVETIVVPNNVTTLNTKDYNSKNLVVPVIKRNSTHITVLPSNDNSPLKVIINSNPLTDTNEITIYASDKYDILNATDKNVVIGPRQKRSLSVNTLKSLSGIGIKPKEILYSKRDIHSIGTRFVFNALKTDEIIIPVNKLNQTSEEDELQKAFEEEEEEDLLKFMSACYKNSNCWATMAIINLSFTTFVVVLLSAAVLLYKRYCQNYNVYPRSYNNVYNETTIPLESKKNSKHLNV